MAVRRQREAELLVVWVQGGVCDQHSSGNACTKCKDHSAEPRPGQDWRNLIVKLAKLTVRADKATGSLRQVPTCTIVHRLWSITTADMQGSTPGLVSRALLKPRFRGQQSCPRAVCQRLPTECYCAHAQGGLAWLCLTPPMNLERTSLCKQQRRHASILHCSRAMHTVRTLCPISLHASKEPPQQPVACTELCCTCRLRHMVQSAGQHAESACQSPAPYLLRRQNPL